MEYTKEQFEEWLNDIWVKPEEAGTILFDGDKLSDFLCLSLMLREKKDGGEISDTK